MQLVTLYGATLAIFLVIDIVGITTLIFSSVRNASMKATMSGQSRVKPKRT